MRLEPLPYPPAERTDVVDDYHGTLVADPYRWLEDPDSPASRAWIEAQNVLTRRVIDEGGLQGRIRGAIERMASYGRHGVFERAGDRWFYAYNDGQQPQHVLMWTDDWRREGRVLLDPNALDAEGRVSLQAWTIDHGGSCVAYGLSDSGSDWSTWRFRDVETGQDRPDVLEWIKFSHCVWRADGAGVFYSRFPQASEATRLQVKNVDHKLYHHAFGTPQSEDRLVFETPEDPELRSFPWVTPCGRFLVIYLGKTGVETRLHLMRLDEEGSTPFALIDTFFAEHVVVGADARGERLLMRTTHEAPRGRLVWVELAAPEPERWVDVVPQGQDVLREAVQVGDEVVLTYLVDAHTQLRAYGLDGSLRREVALPGIGTATQVTGSVEHGEAFFGYTSYTTPAAIYRYVSGSGEVELVRRPSVPFEPEDFETRQVFYTSLDGTRVPLFITHRRGMAPNGEAPTILYGYGGFNVAMVPAFGFRTMTWLQMGGVWAVACIRGGGEYGEAWHQAGTKANKQNVFDDFMAAATWLCEAGYTRPGRLAIAGGSNGGLLVGACVTQRPELFGAAVASAGVLDMLRFHRFTIGSAWVGDYGCADVLEEFPALYAYSPYHNVRPDTAWPATLICTGDHDDRVVSAHSFKFAAAMQWAQAGDAPILIRIETDTGHGAGTPTHKLYDEIADQLAFVAKALDFEP